MACTKLAQDCSVLDFTKMHVVATDKDGTKVVKCSNYDRRKNEHSTTSS